MSTGSSSARSCSAAARPTSRPWQRESSWSSSRPGRSALASSTSAIRATRRLRGPPRDWNRARRGRSCRGEACGVRVALPLSLLSASLEPALTAVGDSGAMSQVEIVIPVHNEERVLAASVHRLRSFLDDRFPYPASITVVDNASTDTTLAVARDLGAPVKVLHLDEK